MDTVISDSEFEVLRGCAVHERARLRLLRNEISRLLLTDIGVFCADEDVVLIANGL